MKKNILFIFLSIFFSCCKINHPEIISEDLFLNPPSSTKPRTWMHAMSGNMSKEGMTKDLEAISEAGVGGVMLFTVTHGIPQGNVKFNSPEYYDIVKHAASECERLGLSFGFHNCDGWSSSGGPWISAKESMRYVVYSQTVTDGEKVSVSLPYPTKRENYYEDIAVLTYPALESEIIDADAKFEVTASDDKFNTDIAFDGVMEDFTTITPDKNKPAYIDIKYSEPFPLRSFFACTRTKKADLKLLASDNGKDYELVAIFPVVRTGVSEWCQQGNVKNVSKRYYRIMTDAPVTISEISLSSSSSINDYLNKNGLGRKEDEFLADSKQPTSSMIIDKSKIKDLTSFVDNEGLLSTTLPVGKWTILRIGVTSTSARNRPASNEGRGLECDKFSASALRKHFDSFPKRFIDSVRTVSPQALHYVEIDSYEMGGQNWTDGMLNIFKSEKGYDFKPFLPLLLGKYVDSAETSEEVLRDFRSVCSYLMNDNYFKAFGDLCKQEGIEYYLEPYGPGPFDFLEAAGTCDIPMGEFWMEGRPLFIEPAISGAHIYGKNIVSAESFTATDAINWKGYPAMTKPTGDWAWKKGFNEFMFHRYAHQSNTHVRPGMTMSKWGFNFDRTQTWWLGAGKSWFKYIARGSYMLRIGVPVTDVMVFVGDASPNGTSKGTYFPYKSDAVNSDVLINRTSVKDSKIVLPEGTTYRCLVLKNTDRITMPTLERLCQLAEAGVPVCGILPEKLLGYNDEGKDYTKFKELVSRISSCRNYYKEGDFERMVQEQNIQPDFSVSNCPSGVEMDYVHRHLANGSDLYFISNTDTVSRTFDCSFRVTGMEPELWFAMDGKIEKADNYSIGTDRTEVSINLEPQESVFVVFRNKASVNQKSRIKTINLVSSDYISDDWTVKFMPEYGYDAEIKFPELIDWSKSENDEIKYYSGSALYTKAFNIDADKLSKANEAILDLGNVNISAELTVNGNYVGIKWMKPYKFDIYEYLKAGENTIELNITNEWTNRLIGDQRFPDTSGHSLKSRRMPDWYINNEPMPETQRLTFDIGQFYSSEDSLLPAGLRGPVCLILNSVK